MIIYFDPNNKNRIMAVYKGCKTSSKVWEKEDYIKAIVSDEMKPSVDHCVVMNEDRIIKLVFDPLPKPILEKDPLVGKQFDELNSEEKEEFYKRALQQVGVIDKEGVII